MESYARTTDPTTSHVAAASIRQANHMETVVLDAIAASPNGLTNHELVEATGLAWNSCTPRIRPLVRKGLVRDSGIRRAGPSYRKCIVWKAIMDVCTHCGNTYKHCNCDPICPKTRKAW